MTENEEMQRLLLRTQQITAQLQAASQQLTQREITGASEGGAVRVTMTPEGDVRSVRIAPSAVDPKNLPRLERLVTEAMQNAFDNVRTAAEQLMRPLTDDVSRLSNQ